MNIESRLTERIGEVGKKLHTGRSRNDQVATDLRLYLRAEIDTVMARLEALLGVLLDLAEREADTIMPGYTHLQAAQPVTLGHHLLAWFEMFFRDRGRFSDCRRRVNVMPLGAAALAGTSFPIDRAFTARELGFEAIAENSLDAVSDRDFAIELCACCGARPDPSVALLRGVGVMVLAAVRFHRAGRCLLHRILDHAPEKEPRRARAGAWQERARVRPLDGPLDLDEGPTPGVQQGQPGGQGTALRYRGHGSRTVCAPISRCCLP